MSTTGFTRSRQGFSLVETLIVLAIIGIAAAIGIPSYLNAVRQAEVREAATQLANDLRRARSLAQRDNVNVAIAITGGSGAYAMAPGQARTLPHGMVVRALAGGNTVTYFAPFGEIDGAARSWQVSTPAGTRQAPALNVNAVGVTGKVNVVGAN